MCIPWGEKKGEGELNPCFGGGEAEGKGEGMFCSFIMPEKKRAVIILFLSRKKRKGEGLHIFSPYRGVGGRGLNNLTEKRGWKRG